MNSWESKTVATPTINKCPYLTYIGEPAYTWKEDNMENIFVSVASAQSNDIVSATNKADLSIPFYLIIIFFLLFTLTMSAIYMYHWINFTFGDSSVRNFSIIYFIGICALLVPILFNLLA